MSPLRSLLALLCLIVLAGPVLAQSGRVALVIGNGAYEAAQKLDNPGNDARVIGDALAAAGFEVTRAEDLALVDMIRVLGEFQRKASKAESAVIYYAGHGMEIDRANYLVPIDARLEFASDAAFQAIPLDLLIRAVSEAGELGLVIADACRNNPFAIRLSQSERTRGVGQGLARVEPLGNALVALSAREGTVALDGLEGNSPYAQALSKALQTPGLEISKLFRTVRDEVMQATGGAQEPVLFGSLSAEDYYFIPAAAQVEPNVEAGQGKSADAVALEVELAFWEAVESSGTADEYALYLQRYPEGVFAPLARARLDRLLGAGPKEPGTDVPVAREDDPETPEPEKSGPGPIADAPDLGNGLGAPDGGGTEIALVPPQGDGPVASPRLAPASETPVGPEGVPVAEAPPEPPPGQGPAAQDVVAVLAPPPDPPPGIAAPVAGGAGPVRSVVVIVPAPEVETAPLIETALPAPTGPVPLQGVELARAMQTELNRLGCGAGAVDGQWGRGSRRALDRLLAAAGRPPSEDGQPTAQLHEMLVGLSTDLCTSQCQAGVAAACADVAKEPANEAKVCPAGQRLSSKGNCYVPKAAPAKAAPSKPRAPASGGNCTVFNGRRICS